MTTMRVPTVHCYLVTVKTTRGAVTFPVATRLRGEWRDAAWTELGRRGLDPAGEDVSLLPSGRIAWDARAITADEYLDMVA